MVDGSKAFTNTKRCAREMWQRHSRIIKLPDYLDASASITKLLCKIAINVAPIVRLRLVDSHISTYLIRLRLAPAVLSRFISCESLCRARERKEERGEWKVKKKKKKERRPYLTFPSILSLHVPFPWESWTRQYRYLQLVSILNCVMARLWTFARCIARVYRFSRGNFFFFFFFVIHVTSSIFSSNFPLEFNGRIN